ncbi:hypothetical protein ABW20_dc0104773 [Dactylellina cionopaga]|nr:hypothetical protein ABW20_dc0104773 [Dactylellina cionopaga]
MTYLLTNPVHLPPEVQIDGEVAIKEEKMASAEEDDDDDDDEHLIPQMGASNLRRMLESIEVQPESKSSTPVDSGKVDNPESASPFPRILKYPALNAATQLELVAETMKVIMAVAGKENPPGRIIVGGEESGEDGEGGVQSVKERMKAVSEELEEFLECAMSVDVPNAVVDEQAEEGNPLQI